MREKFREKAKEIICRRQEKKRKNLSDPPVYNREFQNKIRGTELRCLEFIPNKNGLCPTVFDIHGGGFVSGYPEEDDRICRRICDELGVRVFSLSYRFAPEYPFPEGQLDVYETICHMVDRAEDFGIDREQIVLLGHSAGANFALTSAMRAARTGGLRFRGLILDYPPLDMATSSRDKFYTEGCIPVDLADLFDACYRTPEQGTDPMCSPLFAGDGALRELPPVTILSCELDSLREEDEAFAARLASLGVEVTIRRFLGQRHGFTTDRRNPAAEEAIDMMVRSVRSYLFR